MNTQKIVTVIGGNGFIGNYLVDRLLNKGYFIKIVSRTAESSKAFYPSAKLGQYSLVNCNITNKEKLTKVLQGSFCVINLVGILEKKGINDFENAHVIGAESLVQACNKNSIEKLIHVSAIGVDKNKNSQYATSKLKAENKIKNLKNSLIIRPSIVCGDEDNFLNFFAKYAKFSPFLPLIGGGKTKFQPLLASDLSDIITLSVNKTFKKGQIFEVGGQDILSFQEILKYILSELQLKRLLLNIPFPLAKKMAFVFENLPISLLTRDQVELLKVDNIVNKSISHEKYIKFNTNSFYNFAKKILKVYKKKGGH